MVACIATKMEKSQSRSPTSRTVLMRLEPLKPRTKPAMLFPSVKLSCPETKPCLSQPESRAARNWLSLTQAIGARLLRSKITFNLIYLPSLLLIYLLVTTSTLLVSTLRKRAFGAQKRMLGVIGHLMSQVPTQTIMETRSSSLAGTLSIWSQIPLSATRFLHSASRSNAMETAMASLARSILKRTM